MFTDFAFNRHCLGKNTAIYFARSVEADLTMLIACDRAIIEICTYDAAFQLPGFVCVDSFILFAVNAVDKKGVFERACF